MKLAITSLVCCSALMADSTFMEGDILPDGKYAAGYNASAQVRFEQKTWEPNLSLNASFLYYYAQEDGLDLAGSAGLRRGSPGGTVIVGTSNSITLMQEFTFKPGFKVGFGIDGDNFGSNVEYTWIRQTTSTSKAPISTGIVTEEGVWFLNNWFQQTTAVGQNISATEIDSSWHLAMDIADITVSRPFYQAANVIVSPFAGLRGAWIRQKLNMTVTVPSATVAVLTSSPVFSDNSSNSWGVGPRVGMESSFLLGSGFKINFDLATALLFTQYTSVRHSEQAASAAATPSILRSSLSNVNCVRPELDLALGINWGSYLSNQKCHIEVFANYQFSVFWSQNMMRKLQDQVVSGTGSSPGDLSLQGLEIGMKFCF